MKDELSRAWIDALESGMFGSFPGSLHMKKWRWTRLETIKHQCFDFLMLIGMRDRLRCPKCRAVGTWKPHGGWCELLYEWWKDTKRTLLPGVPYATDRRWLCKYCGYCRCHKGEIQGYPNLVKKTWDEECADSGPTPKQLVDPIWPWRG